MKIVVAQCNFTVGDFSGNRTKIVQAIESGKREGADLVLFSELALCGYPPEDLLLHPAFVEEIEKSLATILPHTEGICALIGLARVSPSSGEKHLLNSAVLVENGAVRGYYDKWLLPTYDVFNEKRYFDEGKQVAVWQIKGKKVGVTICEDIWQHGGFVQESRYQRDPVLALMQEKPDCVVNLSASPYHYAKPQMRIEVCAAAAKSLLCPVVMCTQVGANDQLVFDGFSPTVDGKGRLCALAKGFKEENLLVDLDRLQPVDFVDYDPTYHLYQALVLGVRDYFHKQGFSKGCLGLSGGIDSAVTACIAVEALGKENVVAIGMPSRFSSQSSVQDAQELANHLGIQFELISIDPLFSSSLEQLHPYFSGKPFDTAEENLQARARGMMLMALSNKFGYLVMSTGNKSELAVGYSTLYGDMCGGLGVIADVSKSRVYELARWINRKEEVIPRSTMEKPPSAELRPDQKDSDSLPDYDIVDAVLEGYVEEHLSVAQICKKYRLEEPVVKRLVEMIHRAEYKRRQAAPAIRVTPKAFSVGRRFPIVQKWPSFSG